MQMQSRERNILRITLAGIIFISLLPLLSSIVPFPRTKLKGLPPRSPRPHWNFHEFSEGKYQRGIENWALRDHPFWAWSVKVVNELVYRATGEISLDYGTSIQGGNEGYLWQPMYLKPFNRFHAPSKNTIDGAFKSLKKAQDFFAQHHIPLIADINPNILLLYPDLLPDKYKAIQNNTRSYDVSKISIDTFKPDVIDAYELLQREQPHFPFRFYEPTGSHWNDVGSCLAVREISQKLAAAWQEEIPDPQCEATHIEFPPRTPERDLVDIANLLFEENLYKPAPYVTSLPRPSYKKPKKILLVGTSYLFAVEQHLLKRGIADTTTLLFYFRQRRSNAKGNFRSFDPTRLTKETLLSYDAIILDINASGPGAIGYGFLPLVIKEFSLP